MPSWVTPPDYTTGQILTAAQMDDVSNDLTYLYNAAHASHGGRVPSVLWTTTSTTFTDWNGGTPLTVDFTKRGGTETQIRVDVNTMGYVTGAATINAQLAVRIGSTDYTNSYPHHFNAINDHRHMTESIFISGLTAATYTLKLRVLISAQTFAVDGNDFAQLVPSEVVVG